MAAEKLVSGNTHVAAGKDHSRPPHTQILRLDRLSFPEDLTMARVSHAALAGDALPTGGAFAAGTGSFVDLSPLHRVNPQSAPRCLVSGYGRPYSAKRSLSRASRTDRRVATSSECRCKAGQSAIESF